MSRGGGRPRRTGAVDTDCSRTSMRLDKVSFFEGGAGPVPEKIHADNYSWRDRELTRWVEWRYQQYHVALLVGALHAPFVPLPRDLELRIAPVPGVRPRENRTLADRSSRQ